MSQSRNVCRQKDLEVIQKQIIELPRKDAQRVVNSEIRDVVLKLNQEISQYVKGHGRHEKQLIPYGFLSIMRKKLTEYQRCLFINFFYQLIQIKSGR